MITYLDDEIVHFDLRMKTLKIQAQLINSI